MELNSQKKKKSNKKMGRGSEEKVFQRHTNGQQVHEKTLNITNHQGNANQNHNEITSYLLKWLLSKRQITSVGERL